MTGRYTLGAETGEVWYPAPPFDPIVCSKTCKFRVLGLVFGYIRRMVIRAAVDSWTGNCLYNSVLVIEQLMNQICRPRGGGGFDRD